MSDVFPAYDHPGFSRQKSSIDQLGTYETVLEDGASKGLFGVTAPGEDSASIDVERHRELRWKTVRKQLALLGYLNDPDESGLDDLFGDDVDDALDDFQNEAGIAGRENVDGLDDDTWYALHELVAFEAMEGTEMTEARIRDKWFVKTDDGLRPRNALKRGVELRLFVLGLREEPPGDRPQRDLSGVIKPFLWVCRLFDPDVDINQGYHPAVIAKLYDQDGLVQDLARAKAPDGTFRLPDPPDGFSDSDLQQKARAFAVNAAKAELWMLGLNVSPNAKDDYRAEGFGGTPNNNRLRGALATYWRELQGLSNDDAQSRAAAVTPQFFDSLPEEGEAAPEAQPDHSREVANALEDETDVERVWEEVQEHRLSLWDGLKRVWRWIKRKVSKIVSEVKAFFKNLARAFYRYASKAYKIVRLSVTSVAESIQFYVRGGLRSPDGRLVYTADADLDAVMYEAEDTPPEVHRRFHDRLQAKVDIFRYGARILGIAFRTLRQLATGLTGWALLLKSLVQSLRDLKPHYRALKNARSTLAVA